MTQVTIVTGCAGAGKTERLLDDYRVALLRAQADRRPGSCLWLAPNGRIQRAISQQVLARCGTACFAPNVLTFELFAKKILAASGNPASPISPVMKRLLLRRITSALHQQGELRHFRPIAGTTGFLDVVSSFISELKREEIWPDEFVAACQQRTSAFARRDLELGLIYQQYQHHLAEQNWYDNEGRFWLARSELSERQVRGPFANVRFLVVDGFADFTQTQYEILGHLAAWIEAVSISLPTEHPVTRTDLFSHPQAAIEKLQHQLKEHAPAATCHFVRLPADARERPKLKSRPIEQTANAVQVISGGLFANPRFGQTAADATGLEVIAATGQFGEWEAVARRVKDLLKPHADAAKQTDAQRCRPQDIVIGLRSITDEGPRLAQYLTAAGLPVWCEAESPFTSSCIVKAIVSLLELELEDWPFDRLLAVLDSNYFQAQWPEIAGSRAGRAVAEVLRRIRLHEGRDLMLRALARHASDASPDSARGDSLAELAQLASPLLVRLSRSLDRLRRAHTLADWADVLAALAIEFGWIRQGAESDPLVAAETRDLDLLQRILRTAAEADQKLAKGKRPPALKLADFTSELRDLLSHETLNAPPEPGGCIRILSLEQIRNLDVPYLFLVGLTENSFPMSRAEDCLLSEAERQDFISRGIPLRHRGSHHSDEMLLFYSVVTRARSRLTLSYPAINSKGQPVFPSPYVTALTSLFARDSFQVSHEGQLDPVPSLDRVLTQTDLRLTGIVQAHAGHPELFRAVLEQAPLRRPALNTLAACEVADNRFHQRGFTHFEGQLDLAHNQQVLRQRFGARHQFSATELEAYARCPFQFWLSNVLRIEPVGSPEEGTDFAARGTRLHEVLATLLAEGKLTDPDALKVRFHELLNDQFDRVIPETELQRALIRIEQLILSEWAGAFANQQTEYDQKFRDVLKDTRSLPPEISFGKLPDSPAAAADVYPAIQFGQGNDTVQLRGRIDRVDVGAADGHPGYVVIDYKTGQRPSLAEEELVSGRSIQLPLYLLAIKRLGLVGPDSAPYQMGYWALHDTGFKPGMGKSRIERLDPTKIDWLEILLDRLLPQLAEEIRSGRFVVENDDPNCTGRCAFRTVCRVNQLRPLAESLGKRSAPRVNPAVIDVSTQ